MKGPSTMSNDSQYALHAAPAWDDMAAAEGMGYRADDLRVVSIDALPTPEATR